MTNGDISGEPRTDEAQGKQSGCLKAFAIGCGVFIVLGIIAVVVIAMNFEKIARNMGATGMVAMTDAMLAEWQLPEEEKAETRAVIEDFAGRIRAGEVSVEQIERIMTQFMQGPAAVFVMGEFFASNYLETSEMSAEEKEQARLTLSRYLHGVAEEKIPRETFEEIEGIMTVQGGGGSSQPAQYKQSLTPEELERVLEIMKTAADDAGIEQRQFTIDLSEELRQVIEEGMQPGGGS